MSIFGNVSAAGGFDQSEIDFVTQLISSGQTTIDEVSQQFGVPRDVVASVYAENAPLQTSTTEQAMEELGNWVESQLELGVSPIILIGLIETYKAALTNNLLVDEDE